MTDEVLLTRDGQERKIDVRLQSMNTAFGPFDLDVQEGDFLKRADCPQALVVSEVAKYRSVMTGSDVAHTMLKLVTTSKWHEMQQSTAPSAIAGHILPHREKRNRQAAECATLFRPTAGRPVGEQRGK